jgi:hypothetical protein
VARTDQFPVPALTAVADSVGWNPLATVYVSQKRDQIIVCSMTSPGKGHYIESSQLTDVAFTSERLEVGKAVWEALLVFRRDPNLV